MQPEKRSFHRHSSRAWSRYGKCNLQELRRSVHNQSIVLNHKLCFCNIFATLAHSNSAWKLNSLTALKKHLKLFLLYYLLLVTLRNAVNLLKPSIPPCMNHKMPMYQFVMAIYMPQGIRLWHLITTVM